MDIGISNLVADITKFLDYATMIIFGISSRFIQLQCLHSFSKQKHAERERVQPWQTPQKIKTPTTLFYLTSINLHVGRVNYALAHRRKQWFPRTKKKEIKTDVKTELKQKLQQS